MEGGEAESRSVRRSVVAVALPPVVVTAVMVGTGAGPGAAVEPSVEPETASGHRDLMQLGAGHPMGPLTLADYVGLDTCLFILEGWVKAYPDEPAFVVPKTLRRLVAEGKLGQKSGMGYWQWEGDKRTANPNPAL
jgi:hypothetical protein